MISIKIEGFDTVMKFLDGLPDQILEEYKKYVQEIQQNAIKDCNLKEKEMKLEITKKGTEMSLSFPDMDEKKLECLKQAIHKVTPPDDQIKKIMLEKCSKTKEKLEKESEQ